jgi:beta-lactamase class D
MTDMIKTIFILSFLFVSSSALAAVDFKKIFEDRDACFLISNLRTGKSLAEFNRARCEKRISPYSTFKIAAALMGSEKGILKNENQTIKWDGVKRGRPEIDQDLTPLTWMSESAKWVTEWIMPRVGSESIQSFLDRFNYGNKDFSGGLKDSWVSSSLKISAPEQIAFLSNFWNDKLALSKRTTELTKKIIFIKKLGKSAELYGKTGTGCVIGHACMERPDKMIGWFTGILTSGQDVYVFAGNATDLKPQGPPAGPRMRKATIEILKQLELTPE